MLPGVTAGAAMRYRSRLSWRIRLSVHDNPRNPATPFLHYRHIIVVGRTEEREQSRSAARLAVTAPALQDPVRTGFTSRSTSPTTVLRLVHRRSHYCDCDDQTYEAEVDRSTRFALNPGRLTFFHDAITRA